jgi:hypothetical protein
MQIHREMTGGDKTDHPFLLSNQIPQGSGIWAPESCPKTAPACLEHCAAARKTQESVVGESVHHIAETTILAIPDNFHESVESDQPIDQLFLFFQ